MADLEATLRPYVDSGDVPGLAALIARGDDVRVEALGVQGTSGAPMRRDSIFRGASITKPLTAALAMVLVDEGRPTSTPRSPSCCRSSPRHGC